MQVETLFKKFDDLHLTYGSKNLNAIYGAGKIDRPDVCLIFMNPTSKNIASNLNWKGIKAPWLGTKNVWKLLFKLGLFKNQLILNQIESMKPNEWDETFAENLYKEIEKESLYITNIAKCTQEDARPISNLVYKQYLESMLEELAIIKPKIILTLGNQVSSTILNKPISVSNYTKDEFEELKLADGSISKIYPAYYPVGQGMRNMAKTIVRIENILK